MMPHSRRGLNLMLLLSGMTIAATAIAAQEKPEAPIAKQNTPSPSDARTPQDENPKRILGIIPNFQSKDEDIPENLLPMTPREKYVLAYHQTVDFSAHFGNAATSRGWTAALRAGLGSVRGSIWRGGSGPGYLCIFHLWISAAHPKRRSTLFSSKARIGVVANQVRGHTNRDYAYGRRQSDIQYSAGSWATAATGNFHDLLH